MLLSFVSHPRPKVEYSTKVTLALVTDKDIGGTIVKTTEFKDVDLSAMPSRFKSSDFSVNNLLSIGALNMLKVNYSASASPVQFADTFENVPNLVENVETA